TTVLAAGTCLALAISRSYFEAGGSPTGPSAAMLPISLSFNMTVRLVHSGANARSGSFCRRDNRQVSRRRRCLVDAECGGDSLQTLLLFGRQLTPGAQNLLDQIERLAPRVGVGGEHGRKRGERRFRIDQEDEVLLAHEGLES